jgi:hypothetical protein
MSAIITQNFRLDTTERFVDSLTNNTYYMGLGRPNPWEFVDSQELPHVPYENRGTTNQVWQEIFAMKKIAADDVIFATPRNTWQSGTTYIGFDDEHANIEGSRFTVITNNYNVFICLKSGGTSNIDPDTAVGIQTTGVTETSDGYTWKYLFTIPTDIANKFLTAEFIPVQRLDSDPGAGASQALQDQWSVQDSAVPGAIYNIAIDAGGAAYSNSAVVTIDGNGTGAAATAVITNGVISDVQMTSYGTGYDFVTVSIEDTAGTGASVRGVLPPKGGFGADPRIDLRAHYISLNKVFNGDEAGTIPSLNDFRQISIIKNPFETDGTTICASDAYNMCRSLTVSSGSGAFSSDEIIVANDAGETGASGQVVEYDYDGTTATLYYMQNESTGFTQFAVGDDIGTNNSQITATNDALVKFNSGDVVFVENRDAVSRGPSQIETIRLVIEF